MLKMIAPRVGAKTNVREADRAKRRFKLSDQFRQSVRGLGGYGEEVRRPVHRDGKCRRDLRRRFNQHVRIGSTEAERTHAGDVTALRPGRRFCDDS